MLNGWIKIHRKILDHWVAQEPELLAVWIRLLAEANHSDTKRMFNGRLITIQRGQTLFGLDAFAAKSGVSVSKLRRYMKLLENDGMISRQKTNKYSLISITCYDNYQAIDRQNTGKSQADDNQTTGKRQHRKNVKNDKECKEDIGDKSPNKKSILDDYDFSEWPEIPEESLFEDWIKSKKKAKGSVSQRAINTVGKELTKAKVNGYSVSDCLSAAENSCWKGFKSEWMNNGTKQPAKPILASDLPFPS